MTDLELIKLVLEQTRVEYGKMGEKVTGIPAEIFIVSDKIATDAVLDNVPEKIHQRALLKMADEIRSLIRSAIAEAEVKMMSGKNLPGNVTKEDLLSEEEKEQLSQILKNAKI